MPNRRELLRAGGLWGAAGLLGGGVLLARRSDDQLQAQEISERTSAPAEVSEPFVVVFDRFNFEGRYRLLTGLVANVGDQFNDTVRSIMVRGTWLLYPHQNFRGEPGVVTSGAYANTTMIPHVSVGSPLGISSLRPAEEADFQSSGS